VGDKVVGDRVDGEGAEMGKAGAVNRCCGWVLVGVLRMRLVDGFGPLRERDGDWSFGGFGELKSS